MQWKKYWKYDLYFNEESYYYKENTSENEDFRSTIFQPFQFEPEQKKTCGNEDHEKKTKHINASAEDLLHFRIGNLDWYKCGYCKKEAREIDCLCCIEGNAMLIASAKFLEREGSISPFMSNFPTISHTCYPYLPSRRVLLFAPDVAKRNKNAGWI